MKKELIPELSIVLVGHVDHGKTTLTKALSGIWTDTHSEELKRGITIRLGYAHTTFYKCSKCNLYTTEKKHCNQESIPLRTISFIDAPGHETLMATMLSGTSITDAALLIIAADESCPQPQTKEHLMALEIMGVKNIIIVQNKIDLLKKEDILKNHKQIKEFTKGTIAESAPIIPIAAKHNINIDILIQTIQEKFKTPERDKTKKPIFYIARSFDINKPGSNIKSLKGGVIGGAMKQGVLKINDKVEIKPGIKTQKGYKPLKTEITSLNTANLDLKEISPGGSAGILTKLDPSLVKSDNLTGNILGLEGEIPKTYNELTLKTHLLERMVGSKDELTIEPIKKNEILMLNVNSAATVGTVTELKKDTVKVILKLPVCAEKADRVTISRKLGTRWRLIGYSEILN